MGSQPDNPIAPGIWGRNQDGTYGPWNPFTETPVDLAFGPTLGVLQIVSPNMITPSSVSPLGASDDFIAAYQAAPPNKQVPNTDISGLTIYLAATETDIDGTYTSNWWVINWANVSNVTAYAPYVFAPGLGYGSEVFCYTQDGAAFMKQAITNDLTGITVFAPTFFKGYNYRQIDVDNPVPPPSESGQFLMTVVFNKSGLVSVDYGD
jgi:hypothetical protein